MWADPFVLRIGGHHDLLVAIQADTDESTERLRALFAAWVDDGIALGEVRHRPAFKVRLAPVTDHVDGHPPGPKPVPQLRHGSCVIARSRQPDDIVRALARVLGGAHVQRRDDGRLWLPLRLFVREGAAVLVDADPPTLVNDRRMAESGIDELVTWSITLDADDTVAVPPPLPRLDWHAAGVDAPHDGWRRLPVARVVALRHDRDGPDGLDDRADDGAATARLRSLSHQTRWAEMLASFDATGRIDVAGDHAGLRRSITATS